MRFELDAARDFDRAGREIEDGLHAGRDHRVDRELRRRRRHGDHHDANPLALDDLPKIACVGDQNPAARAPADLLLERVEQRDHLEPVLAEAGVIGKREAEVAGTHDRHTDVAIETEDLLQVPPQLLDVVPDAAYAELAEVRQVLPNLRRIQLELLGKRLRRNRADAHRIEGRQRAQIHRQAIGGQLRHGLDLRPGRRLAGQLVLFCHKRNRL